MASISPLLSPAPPELQSGAGPDASPKSDPAKIEHAAKAFESLMIGQILKASHADGSANWLGCDDDPAGESATELAEEQFAQALASTGGLGLAKLITQGLTAGAQGEKGS